MANAIPGEAAAPVRRRSPSTVLLDLVPGFLGVPVALVAWLGLVTSWPVDCGAGGCGGDSDLAGSTLWATVFGVALMLDLVPLVAGVVGKREVAWLAFCAGLVVTFVAIAL